MIEAVFFDMDGVIIDSELFYFERRLAFLKEKNEVPMEQDFTRYIGAGEKTIWELLVPQDREKRKALKKEYQGYRERHEIDFEASLIAGFIELLNYLNECSIKTAIVSSASNYQIEKLIAACKLEDKINFYISGEDFEKSKPNPAVYEAAAVKSGVGKENILVIEDSEVGIEAGKEAGLVVVAIDSPFMDQRKADYHLENHIDLMDLIKEMKNP